MLFYLNQQFRRINAISSLYWRKSKLLSFLQQQDAVILKTQVWTSKPYFRPKLAKKHTFELSLETGRSDTQSKSLNG